MDQPHDAAQHRRALRNVGALVAAQSLMGAQLPIFIILGGLAGGFLAENKALATLPVSFQMLASMCAAAPASMLMGRIGRRPGFILGALAGAAAGGLAAWAIFAHSFWLLCAAHVCVGIYQSFQGFFRFAAADTASDAFRPKAISWTMAGGLTAALLGPSVLNAFTDAWPPFPFVGAYLASASLALIGIIPLMALDIPRPKRQNAASGDARPLREIMLQPAVMTAVICAMVSYAVMNLVMTSTPIAMVGCGYAQSDAADVVRWHAFSMYAPSFFTGSLIARFGAPRIIALGLILLAACAGVALSGIAIEQFYIALILLGLGWNFGFVGATALLSANHRPSERAKVQGLNDVLVFGLVSIASFSSGALMHALGWDAVNLAMAPFLILAGAALIGLMVWRRGRA